MTDLRSDPQPEIARLREELDRARRAGDSLAALRAMRDLAELGVNVHYEGPPVA